MGKVAEWAREWLDECGYVLGYDYDTMPSIDKCKRIKQEYHSSSELCNHFQSIGKIIKKHKMNQIKYWEKKNER